MPSIFDEANKFLAEVANMNPKPEIISEHSNCDWKAATLPDGRWIAVSYDEKGEIDSISIAFETNPEGDDADVRYIESGAAWDKDRNNSGFDLDPRCLLSSAPDYDFEKLKALAKKIFG